ncbi:helix-turn-helix domain-containing protein [Calidifontibacter sp. DB0510]|uniref:Helix-turn-helix domain-containing protein n=1 Tax=Metallococcus carri TaxID=1656884 RepID=A0A967AWS7_9MICO|nr:helix-turn-helix domain-containing protein [Metallococcus carri]NHN54396.1 helix-turn-helix domain-containing protein [Metallococcus carri]NOP36765.1 helix-turn-helix domain-containing protein [Calidifontibacter sp. DB2511S]
MTSVAPVELDPLLIGRRLRHVRSESGRTLGDVAGEVGMSASALSLIENGKREPKLSVLSALASALGTSVQDLLTSTPPTRRAALEIKLERAQRRDSYQALGIPAVKIGPRLPMEALEALVGMHEAMAAAQAERAATPEQARRANAELRLKMRAADNYFGEIEAEAGRLLGAINHPGGPISRAAVDRLAGHLGFRLVHTSDLPASTRTVTDLHHKRIYLPQPEAGQHDSRSLALQALGHLVLDHQVPADYAEFLSQRVEINYFAAALLMPESETVAALRTAMKDKDIAIEDLRDAWAVSYETAAHRFTNLATKHLGIHVHFMRIAQSGVIYKAYENDGVIFPSDATGAIEGQRVCRAWTARRVFEQPDLSQAFQAYTDTRSGTYWCTAVVDRTPDGLFSVNVGVPYQQVKWMRGRETTHRAVSRCPDPSCCTQPPPDLAGRWQGQSWPSARVHSHLLAAMPPGVFPGVDDTEIYQFLDRHAPTD